MRGLTRAFLLAGFLAAGAAAAQSVPPYWAFPVPTHAWPRPDPTENLTMPGSSVTMTRAQASNLFAVPDWHPEGHPPMPSIVAEGRKPAVPACGYCHLPNGHGRPENAALAGQPAAYLIEQVMEFRAGRRKSSEPRMGPVNSMAALAKAVTEDELKSAADYFSGLRMTKWIRVVETDTVPKTDIARGNMMMLAAEGGSEPIDGRIIEVPEDFFRTEARDASSGFVAYVPKGSIAKGAALVKSGDGKAPCAACHGADLKGQGMVPGLAGRSPSSIVRQLYDFQNGARGGPAAAPMAAETAGMRDEDRVAIAAYLASLLP